MNKIYKNYLTISQLKKIGFLKIGKNCKISNKISAFNLSGTLGDNVRIDDDVHLKGKIDIRSNVHLARGCTLSGTDKGIFLDDFAAISNFVQFYTNSDDYFNPSIPVATLDKKYRKNFSKTYSSKIFIGKCCLVGSMSVLLPGTDLQDYSSVAALSIVYNQIPRGYFYSSSKKGIIKKRDVLSFIKLHEKYKSAKDK
jgi:galactoside O-acetyltransferase